MAKKEISKEALGLKKELEEGKVVIGVKSVLKGLQGGLLGKVYLARNCLEGIKGEVRHYAGLAKVPVKVLGMSNEEVGVFCKKHFFISVLGVRK